MLNRTNLTLSLSALSNRLNLGTRSLVLGTSANHGNQTLRIRHAYHDVMRETVVWSVEPPFSGIKRDIPPMPDSIIPDAPQRPIRCVGRDASRSACQQSIHKQLRARQAAARTAPAAIAAVAEA
jgi:hypothetical protein